MRILNRPSRFLEITHGPDLDFKALEVSRTIVDELK
jgi:hypothetical protein